MKPAFLLTASVVLNIALGVAYYLKPARVVPMAEPLAQGASGSNSSEFLVEKRVTNVVTVTEPAERFDWRKVESDNYKQYVTNLRAIGCPEKTLRDIIMADVTDLFRERARSSTSNRFEYWKGGLLGNAFDEKRLAQQQEQARERREILKNLLGQGYSVQADPAGGQIVSPMEQMTGDFLSPEQQATMRALEVKYAARILKAAKDGGGEESEAMRKAFADKDAEILSVLSPDEKFEYDLRLSQPAILLRMSLGGFEPTEDEFRQMFQTTRAFTDRFGLGVITRLGKTREGDGEVNEMLDGLRTTLGEARFQQFQSQRLLAAGQSGK
jgi:hypothetical protein